MIKNTITIAKFLLFSLCLTVIFSCGESKNTEEIPESEKTSTTEKVASNDNGFTIDTFKDFPEGVDGCSCYFSTDKTEFEKPNYVYVDDYDKHAYVSINGKMTKFTLVTADTASEKTILKVFANDQYEVTIYGKQVSQMDETWQYEGTMVVKEIDGKSISKTIYGECGC